jgi:hypothetical protein
MPTGPKGEKRAADVIGNSAKLVAVLLNRRFMYRLDPAL